jgi:hypothetical protein
MLPKKSRQVQPVSQGILPLNRAFRNTLCVSFQASISGILIIFRFTHCHERVIITDGHSDQGENKTNGPATLDQLDTLSIRKNVHLTK